MEGADESIADELGPEDIVIVGANALDIHGNAAIMAGRALGGNYGKLFSRFMAEAGEIIVTVGLEKLVPGNIQDIVRAAKRKGAELTMGMCVGLLPIIGKVITEVEAIETLAPVKCIVIGRGGIKGAEGGTTLLLNGPVDEVERLFKKIWDLKGTRTSGTTESFEECGESGPGCPYHQGCVYSHRKKESAVWRERLKLES